MGRADLLLKVSEIRTQRVFGALELDQEPGLVVPDDDEVDFALRRVAEVAELEVTESAVRLHLNGLEQEARNVGLRALSGITASRPIA